MSAVHFDQARRKGGER